MLSIISITKDDCQGIYKTLGSTLRLRRTNKVEQIVVDSSTSKNSATIKTHTDKQQNVTYYHQPPQGISSAFNLGTKIAKNDWVWFLNGGDELHPTVDINLLLSILDSTTADIVIFELESENGVSTRPPFPQLWPPLADWVPHPATIVKRDLLLKVGGFDESFKIAMDCELWLRMFPKAGKIDMISVPLTKFAPGGLSSDGKATFKEGKQAANKHALMLIKTWLKNGLMQLKIYYEYSKK
jgi:glycosyltransferase involved in cell wall biosynthesis